ncbi:hypothetical protein [Jongsikchunia kroppenstedtii]|uniref:hypothetical protein n=1 Tax=Jongsikchunia kroppenstedtii TaxID=1121721 RepID=UPI000368DACA|nr:hypothetical protein [Jongsikchunia kroppenstedtii]
MAIPQQVPPAHVVGAATTEFVSEHDAMLDELVFDAVYHALRECGLRKADIGISVLASLDAYDGRSISSGLTTSASGGYLVDSFRVEADMGAAIIAAAQAISSGDMEVAVAVGVHNPENRAGNRREFLEAVSNLGFDPHFARPVGMTAEASFGLHASREIADGRTTVDELAALSADSICRGASGVRAMRADRVDAADVLASLPIHRPLRELMLPAHSAGAVALVLASPARAGRCIGRDVRLRGFASATGGYTWDGDWLQDPAGPTRRAAELAYAQAGVADPAAEVSVAEYSAATAALDAPVRAGLSVDGAATVNASGGLLSNYPGIANGGLRLIEVMDRLDEPGRLGVAHSVDTVTGLVSQDASVLVAEAV